MAAAIELTSDFEENVFLSLSMNVGILWVLMNRELEGEEGEGEKEEDGVDLVLQLAIP